MATLDGFAQRMNLLAIRVAKQIPDLKSRAALAAVESLAEATPVDKGVAVSNWRIGVGSPVGNVIPAHVPGELGSTREANIRTTVNAARSVLERVQGNETLHVGNNVPYLDQLNSGSSSQAPAGFVEQAVADIEAEIERSTLLR